MEEESGQARERNIRARKRRARMAEEQMAAILQRLVDLEGTRGVEAVAEGVRQQAITVATRTRNERVDLGDPGQGSSI